MKSWNLRARGLTGTALALTALIAGSSCDFGTPIRVTNGTEVEGLTGTLVVTAGSPAVGAWVRVFPVSPTVLAKNTSSAKGAADAVVTALDSMRASSSGSFQFKDLADGTYNVAATLQHGDTTYSMFLRDIIVVGNTHLGVDTLLMSGSLTLQALSGSTAVANAECSIAGSPWQATSNASGICVLTGVPPGVFQVTVTHPTYSMTISGDITVQSDLLATAAPVELVATSSPLPAAPLLVSPASQDTVQSLQPALIWRGVANAASYHVQLSTDSVFTALLVNDSGRVDTSRASVSLEADTRYYWRARAKNSTGVSPWSARRSFRTFSPTSPGEESLLARWTFDEVSGALASDVSGNSRNGVIAGPANRVAGVQGTALEFNGGTHVEVADSLINVNGDFTFTAWVWQSSQSSDHPVIDFCCTGNYVGFHMWVNTPGSGQVSPGRLNSNLRPAAPANAVITTAAGILPTGTWNHIAVSYESQTRKGRIYANGVARDSITLEAGQVPSLAGTMYMGYRATNTTDARSGARFIGRLDDVRLYSKRLTTAEITSMHGSLGSGSVPSTPIVASQDAYILAAAPSQSGNGPHGSSNFGKSVDFAVGTYDMNTVGRGLVRFSLPEGIKAADINRAVIRVRSYKWITKLVQSDSVRINLHKVLRDWKEGGGASSDGTPNSATVDGVTGLERMWGTQNASEDWNQRLVGLNDIDASSSVVAQAMRPRSYIGYWEFDVTSLVKAWADQPATNFGVLLAGIIPPGDPQTEDYPVIYTRDAAVADSLKPVLILNGPPLSSGGGNNPVTVPLPPAAPILVSPPQWDNGVPNPPTLTWNAVTDAASYQLQVAADSLFDSVILSDSGFTTTSRTVNNLLYSTEYYWRVRARNTAETGAWSTTFRFMTTAGGAGVLPTPIDILEPLQGATNVPRQSAVSWSGGAGTIKLQVIQVALDSAFTHLVHNDSSKFNGTYIVNAGTSSTMGRSMGTLASGTTHYVRVILGNDAGVRVSETRRFTTAHEAGAPLVWNHVTSPTSTVLQGLVKADSNLIAVGTAGVILASTDGVSWSAQLSGTTNSLQAVGRKGALIVAVGVSGTILTSPNGHVWTSRVSGTTNSLYAVAASTSRLVAVGVNGVILTSEDGLTWTARTSGTTRTLYGLTWNGVQFVAVGSIPTQGAGSTTILTSPDGINWTARTSGTTSSLYSVSWNGSLFVATGSAGTIITSPDGVTWTSRASGTTAQLYASAWNGTRYVAVGSVGTALTSTDGVTWTPTTSGFTGALYAVQWNGARFVTVGLGGTILTSNVL